MFGWNEKRKVFEQLECINKKLDTLLARSSLSQEQEAELAGKLASASDGLEGAIEREQSGGETERKAKQ
jgi:hypothetical protein